MCFQHHFKDYVNRMNYKLMSVRCTRWRGDGSRLSYLTDAEIPITDRISVLGQDYAEALKPSVVTRDA